jgi:DNA-binding NarL/FixJ family response regulator
MKAKNDSKFYKGLKRIRVFLVDDDMLFLKALEHSIINKLPLLEIKTFQTGEACLQQMKLKPDVIVLDYCLNSQLAYAWDGIDILKRIKVLNPTTKVILLSSQDSIEVADDCFKNGLFEYVSKSKTAFVKINNVLSNIIKNIKGVDVQK